MSKYEALERANTCFRRWFGQPYDLAVLHAVLATLAAERLDGDPVWLLLVGGPGDAKTETVQSAAGADALVTSTITSEGALLSGSSKKDTTKGATGGLLRRIGERGVVVIKDVTSILSMSREARASVLAALREVYDGKWERNVGSDGGKSMLWTGRIAVIGAVTTAWDHAHSVISSMGDRFTLMRLDSRHARLEKGRQAVMNIGSELTMRAELASVVGLVIKEMNTTPIQLSTKEGERLQRAADLVTRCRTAVEYDYRGSVVAAHMLEAPTRFVKQLSQIARGACAIGLVREEALKLAMRCARDSMPELRLAILESVPTLEMPDVSAIARNLGKPRTTVERQVESLCELGALAHRVEETVDDDGEPESRAYYSLATGIDPTVLSLSPEMSVGGVSRVKKVMQVSTTTAKSGASREGALGKSRRLGKTLKRPSSSERQHTHSTRRRRSGIAEA